MAKMHPGKREAAFTLVEVLVAIAVLALLVALIGQLFSNTSAASSVSTTHMEADARVRLLFERMAADFSHMVKRTDIDFFLKPEVNANSPTSMNDQMAFYSEVPGYSSATDAQNSVSLVGYRLNPYPSGTPAPLPCLERLGTALTWGSSSTGILPVVFSPITIASIWPSATMIPASSASTDAASDASNPNYETILPNAFRFEYYYQLRNGTLSAVPYDTTTTTSISGLQDVAGIGVAIAVTDRKASAMATSAQLQTLGNSMVKFTTGWTVGTLQSKWQTTASSSTLSAPIKNGIRVYEQLFLIDTPSQ